MNIINRCQFLFDNPLLLQDLISQEKEIPLDNIEINWTVPHPINNDQQPVVQVISLARFHRSYLASRFHIRIVNESSVLAMPNLVFPFDCTTWDLNELRDIVKLGFMTIPPVVEEFLSHHDSNDDYYNCYMILLHHSKSCWEMIGCLSPITTDKINEVNSNQEDNKVPYDDSKKSRLEPIIPPSNCETPKNTNSSLNQCTICNQDFLSRKNLLRHLVKHDINKHFKCPAQPECIYSTVRKDLLNRHIARRHPQLLPADNRILHKCPTCKKGFRLKSFYERHVEKGCSLPVRTFTCPSCDFVITGKRNFKNHQCQTRISFHRTENSSPILKEFLSSENRHSTNYSSWTNENAFAAVTPFTIGTYPFSEICD